MKESDIRDRDTFKFLVLVLAEVDAVAEQVDVGLERELVHRIHLGQVVQHEEAQRGSDSTRSVPFTCDIDLLFRLL